MSAKTKSPKAESSSKSAKGKQTVRERTQTGNAPSRRKRIRSGAGKVGGKVKNVAAFGQREYHMPLPDNKAGRILKKRVPLIPRFIRNSWAELRQVKWPNRRETRRLTIAVLIFSVIFGISVSLLDAGLDKLFKEVIIKK